MSIVIKVLSEWNVKRFTGEKTLRNVEKKKICVHSTFFWSSQSKLFSQFVISVHLVHVAFRSGVSVRYSHQRGIPASAAVHSRRPPSAGRVQKSLIFSEILIRPIYLACQNVSGYKGYSFQETFKGILLWILHKP